MQQTTPGYPTRHTNSLSQPFRQGYSRLLAGACLLLLLVFAGVDLGFKIYRQDREIQVLAELTAFNSSAALAFEDPRSSKEILALLGQQQAALCYARLASTRQPALAEYRRHSPGKCELGLPVLTEQRIRTIQVQDEKVGELILHYERTPVYADVAMDSLLLGMALLLGYLLLCRRLDAQRTQHLEHPLQSLTRQLAQRCAEEDSPPDLQPLTINNTLGGLKPLALQINRLLVTLALQQREQVKKPLPVPASKTKETTQDSHTHHLLDLASFLASISHEIRTPMHGILGMADLLAASPLSPEQQEHLGNLHAAASDLFETLNQLLGLSALEVTSLSLAPVAFAPRELLNTLCQSFQPALQRKGLQFQYSVSPTLPEQVLGDPIRLQQLLAFFLSQAIRVTQRGQISLQLGMPDSASPTDPAHRQALQVTVQDSGPGLASATPDTPATPGLAAVKRLIEQLGGDFQDEHTPGWGSRYQFTLPVHNRSETP